jgi:SOS-response transcriptional repressor LexA
MPHALSERQKEYLVFLKEYIRNNEDTPSLKEIAEYFGVKPPTAHKVLEALQKKDFIFYLRHPDRGFIIRLIERGGLGEKIIPLYIIGSIDQYGELVDLIDSVTLDKIISQASNTDLKLPESIPIIQKCNAPFSFFGLRASHDIQAINVKEGDVFVVDTQKMPQDEFLSLLPVGPQGRIFLCRSHGKTFDDRTFSVEMREPYPLPEKFVNWELGQRMFWLPVTWEVDTDDNFWELVEKVGLPVEPIPMDLVGATILELIREY